MSDFDDLDSLLGPLREPATLAELASERAMIDRMVTSHRNPKGTPMFSSRRARVATLIAAGVIGFGGVAAAGGGLSRTSPGDTPDVDPAPQVIEIEEIEEEVEVEETTTTTAAAAKEKSDDDTLTDEVAKATPEVAAVEEVEVLVECLPGNHGKTVSSVARSGAGGVEVRKAAQSDCGKPDNATKVDDDDDDDDDDEDIEIDDDSDDYDDDADDDDDDDDDDDEDDDARGSKGGNGNGNRGKSGKDD